MGTPGWWPCFLAAGFEATQPHEKLFEEKNLSSPYFYPLHE